MGLKACKIGHISGNPAEIIASCGRFEKRGSAAGKKSVPKGAIDQAQFIFENTGTVSQSYDMMKKLGDGASGSVLRGKHKTTGAMRAIKTLSKSMKRGASRVKQEIAIMKAMDHPNAIKLYETYEDEKNYYLVMELCTGGELFDRIIECGHFTEVQAAIIMQQVVQVIHYMHGKHLCHRDLKPENLLFKKKQAVEDTILKVIDFGLSCPFSSTKQLTTKAGSLYYISPEVIEGKYDHSSDIWSCGVIMYILLCGSPPFAGTADSEVLSNIRKGTFAFEDRVWDRVSEDAKKLIQGMLTVDPRKRCTAEAAMSHHWIKKRAPEARSVSLQEDVVANLRSFQAHNKLKKAALHVIAGILGDDEIKALRRTFQALDRNGDGHLTGMEIKQGIQSAGLKEITPDIQQIMLAVDADGDGVIDYTEFIAAALDKTHYSKTEACQYAFQIFDRNGDGQISQDELKEAVGQQAIPGIMSEIDSNGDGIISWDEFKQMMKK